MPTPLRRTEAKAQEVQRDSWSPNCFTPRPGKQQGSWNTHLVQVCPLPNLTDHPWVPTSPLPPIRRWEKAVTSLQKTSGEGRAFTGLLQ